MGRSVWAVLVLALAVAPSTLLYLVFGGQGFCAIRLLLRRSDCLAGLGTAFQQLEPDQPGF